MSSLKIFFPYEKKMKLKKLDKIKDALNKIYSKKIGDVEIENLSELLGKLQGYLVVADRDNLKEYYEHFRQLDFLSIFNNFIEKTSKR